MSFWESFKAGCSWLYEKAKTGIIAAGKWLKKKLPILGAWILAGTKCAIKLAKGAIFGAYYGMKDGYHVWKGDIREGRDRFCL